MSSRERYALSPVDDLRQRREAKVVPCSWCGVDVDEDCVTPEGRPMPSHRVRVTAYLNRQLSDDRNPVP